MTNRKENDFIFAVALEGPAKTKELRFIIDRVRESRKGEQRRRRQAFDIMHENGREFGELLLREASSAFCKGLYETLDLFVSGLYGPLNGELVYQALLEPDYGPEGETEALEAK